MRVVVWLASVAACSAGATSSAPAPVQLAPVETAQFNWVPDRQVQALPVTEDPQPPPRTVQDEPQQTLAMPARASPSELPLAAWGPELPHERVTQPGASQSAVPTTPQANPASPAGATLSRSPSSTKTALSRPSAAPAMSGDARSALARVLRTSDNGAAPFIVIDKRNARMWLFDARGLARGDSAVLLGLARGDDTVPGVGDKPLAGIRVSERTTPAGRFVAEPGRNARGDDIFWIDYEAAVSMHRVHDVNRGERRVERLASASVADNRISYGCINVPTAFYDRVLLPLVGGKRPVVYVLPETRSLDTIFNPSTDALAARAPRPIGKGPSWRPSTNTVSEFSNPSTTW
jgi:hypothetical protein